MFWFKRKKIVVDAFTSVPTMYDLFKIESASQFFPDWWKSLPSKIDMVTDFGVPIEHPTMKRCEGFLELYRNGFVIPLWSDLNIKTHENGDYAYMYSFGDSPEIVTHNTQEHGGHLTQNHIHLKLFCNWKIVEKTGVNFYFGQPFWNQIDTLDTMHTPPAIVNFKYQVGTNVNILLAKRNATVKLKHGSPLVHLIPLSENEVEIRNHLISEEEIGKLRSRYGNAISFVNKYKNNKRLTDLNNKPKCPFGFGK